MKKTRFNIAHLGTYALKGTLHGKRARPCLAIANLELREAFQFDKREDAQIYGETRDFLILD